MFPKAADKRSLVKNVYISLSASELPGWSAVAGLPSTECNWQVSGVKLFSGHRYYVEVIYSRYGQSEGPSLIQLVGKDKTELALNIYKESFSLPYKNYSDKAQMKIYGNDLPHCMCLLVLWQR